MLRYFTLVLFMSLVASHAYSQCVPDTTNYEFFSPAPENISCVIVGQPYTTVLQNFCPPQVANIRIDSIVLLAINNLPQGLTYRCNTGNCTIRAWEHGCVEISGTTNAPVGRYQLENQGFAYTSAGTFSFSQLQGNGAVPQYYLDVFATQADCTGTTGVAEVNNKELPVVMYNYQTGQAVVTVHQATHAQWMLTDITGRLLQQGEGSLEGTTHIQLATPSTTGVYFISVRANGTQVTTRIVL